MSIIHYEEAPNHFIDYIDNLPTQAQPLRKFRGQRLKSIYWYDPELKRVIKKNKPSDKHPYRYYRSCNVVLCAIKSCNNIHIELADLISELDSSYAEKISEN